MIYFMVITFHYRLEKIICNQTEYYFMKDKDFMCRTRWVMMRTQYYLSHAKILNIHPI